MRRSRRSRLPEERAQGGVRRPDLDPRPAQLLRNDPQALLEGRVACDRKPPQREPLPRADVDPVRTEAAARLPEEPSRLGRVVAEALQFGR